MLSISARRPTCNSINGKKNYNIFGFTVLLLTNLNKIRWDLSKISWNFPKIIWFQFMILSWTCPYVGLHSDPWVKIRSPRYALKKTVDLRSKQDNSGIMPIGVGSRLKKMGISETEQTVLNTEQRLYKLLLPINRPFTWQAVRLQLLQPYLIELNSTHSCSSGINLEYNMILNMEKYFGYSSNLGAITEPCNDQCKSTISKKLPPSVFQTQDFRSKPVHIKITLG